MSLNTGQVIDDKYQILRLLGTGGMGAVYEGENVRIKRRVAIKVLHASVSSSGDNVARFEREAQAAGRIGSEHICEVLDLGALPDESRYMVMEYLDGETLSARIKKHGRLTPAQSIPLMSQVLEALGAAHAAGIIHRDLKPDNIFILPSKAGRTDFIKILDFGVSKFSQLSGEEMNVTRAGAVVGTPYYMSPEQARGMAQVDARSDIYALGVVLYQATTGQVPFRAETFNELLFKIALELPPPPQQFVQDLDPEFAGIIQRAMAREQAHRFQSCAEFKDALVAWQAARAAPQAYGHQPRPGGMYTTGSGTTVPPGMIHQPFGQTPQPGMISGVLMPMNMPGQTGVNPDGSQATANAWGHASASGSPPTQTSSRSGAIIGFMVTLVMVGGLGVAGYFVFGKKDPAPSKTTPVVAATNPTTTNTPQPVATPSTTAEAVPTPDADADAGPGAAEREVALDEPPAPSAAGPVPTAPSGPVPTGTSTTKTGTGTTTKPGGTGTNKTKPPGGGVDLGY